MVPQGGVGRGSQEHGLGEGVEKGDGKIHLINSRGHLHKPPEDELTKVPAVVADQWGWPTRDLLL